MVSAVLLPNAKACFITSAGAPAVGYKLYTYDAGTLVPRTTYLDAAGAANNTNPIILDARGEAVIYWDGSYKVILKDPADVVIWTADNVSQGPLSNPVPWAAAAGSVDAITATYAPAITALTDGLLLTFRATGANTLATPNFSPNGLTARTIVKAGGQALIAGDIPRANYECLVRYNLANTRWELIDPVPLSTISGTQASVTAVPVTLFSASPRGMYLVHADIGPINDTSYAAWAIVVSDGGGAAGVGRIGGQNGANLTISTSGLNVQSTQISGGNQTISWSYVKMPT